MTAIVRGADLKNLHVDNARERELFNYYAKEFCDEFELVEAGEIDHKERQSNWRYPSKYDELDLEHYFVSKCETLEQAERVLMELELYKEKEQLKLLRWSIWFMDFVNENDIFIGVGRGSSVSSYCLYLIGLHMVDSLAFDLDVTEFLK